MNTHQVVLIPGDGIGPEVTAAVKRILSAARSPVEWLEFQAGLAAVKQGKELLPAEVLDAIREYRVALKGPCTTPVGEGFTSINVSMRKQLKLYAAVRPVRSLAGVPTRYQDVDLVIVRENTEGLYSGVENQVTDGVVMSMKVATEAACLRIARWAFQFAVRRNRKKVTVMHKANIMKLTDGLFLRCARQVHDKDFPQLPYGEVIVDAGCAKLVQDPTQFDVLLMENLYGDMLSDLCAGLVGGLGVTPGANIGDDAAVFEAVHGSATGHRRQGNCQSPGVDHVGRNDAEPPGGYPRLRSLAPLGRTDQGRLQLRAGPGAEDPRPRRRSFHFGFCRRGNIPHQVSGVGPGALIV